MVCVSVMLEEVVDKVEEGDEVYGGERTGKTHLVKKRNHTLIRPL